MHKDLIKDIGEKELIKRLAKFMPKGQVSDDCAFIKTKNKNLIINTDTLVENVHFTDETISSLDIGWKAVVSNLSDLLSSGSKRTLGISIGLIMPAKTEWNWIEEFYKGVSQALEVYGGIILGGDCSLGREKVISITALGIQGELRLRRNACKPGEIILISGVHGLSKLGLMLRSNHNLDKNILLTQNLINESLKEFCRPELECNFSKKLLKARSNKKITRVGCTDSSDGLMQALQDLATESNCKAIIDYKKIPRHKDWPQGKEWDNYYFFGGEDYRLVFSLPKKWAQNFLKIDKNSREIGYFVQGNSSVELKNSKNSDLLDSHPFRHF